MDMSLQYSNIPIENQGYRRPRPLERQRVPHKEQLPMLILAGKLE